MRIHLLAAVAAVALATPAAARDGAGYFGVEGGLILPNDTGVDVDVTVDGERFEVDDAVSLDYKPSFDADLIGGYDFGLIRAEAELGYKRLRSDQIELDDDVRDILEDELGGPITDEDLDFDAKGRIISLMGNLLFDFGNEDGASFYVGGGFGRAWVKAEGEGDDLWAHQLIAGVRTALSPNIDAGLKYRYFRTSKYSVDEQFAFDGMDIDAGLDTRFSSHSILASLVYNFSAPRAAALAPLPPAMPAPPAPPATQTCPDGTVILVTELCPPAPPPPPPPPVIGVGERG